GPGRRAPAGADPARADRPRARAAAAERALQPGGVGGTRLGSCSGTAVARAIVTLPCCTHGPGRPVENPETLAGPSAIAGGVDVHTDNRAGFRRRRLAER